MDKVSSTIRTMLAEMITKKNALTKRQWLVKRKGVDLTITVERGDKLNGPYAR